jgi:hypothetical protein
MTPKKALKDTDYALIKIKDTQPPEYLPFKIIDTKDIPPDSKECK